MNTSLNRRAFVRRGGTVALAALTAGRWPMTVRAAADNEAAILERIRAHRPSQLAKLPPDFCQRVGAAHVAGRYHLTKKPFLLEGAEKLLELGTRLGKFWFTPNHPASSYPFNSQWDKYSGFVDLAKSDYFKQLFALPFRTLLLEAHSPVEEGWRKPGQPEAFYQAVTREFYDLTKHLYQTCRDRDLTIVLQHWEGDWLLRGRGGELWNPPPKDWQPRCEAMVQWLAARQAGVTKARAEQGAGAKCVVAHATEVNRVADLWQKIPTMTEHVLPHVELDLVSYSAYDGMKDPLTLWKCIAEIRRHCRTGPLFGKEAMFVGEIGIPENDAPKRLVERWDEFMGVMLAAEVTYIAHWELYCNEFKKDLEQKAKPPITNPALMRGFWLVKPDGSLSESGNYFAGLWKRAQQPG